MDEKILFEMLEEAGCKESRTCARHLIENGVIVQEHGQWIVCGDGEYVPCMCSACGKTTSWYHAQTANYCPNCGAKMDLED